LISYQDVKILHHYRCFNRVVLHLRLSGAITQAKLWSKRKIATFCTSFGRYLALTQELRNKPRIQE